MSEAMTRRDPNETTLSISEPLQSLSLTQSPDESLAARTGDSSSEDEEYEGLRQEGMLNNPRIQRYLIAVEYIGTGFSGVQQQLNCRTVCGVLENAFQKFIGLPVSISCSSRTDSGVHALSNVCHVDVERVSKRRPGEVLPPHEPEVVRKAVNHFLQKNEGDLTLIDVRCVSGNFHARFNAKERTYFYRLLSGPGNISKFEKERAWHVHRELDISSMQKACQVLVGTHDYSSFRAAGCQANLPIRTLDELNVTEVSPSPYFPTIQEREHPVTPRDERNALSNSSSDALASGGFHTIEIPKSQLAQNFGLRRMHRCYIVTARGRSFLYHQVRLLVGVLKCVGTGQLTIPDVERILKAKDVTAASPMAPACGLYLGSVGYDLSEDTA
uniref:tRNA pseudouridine synthase n=1 Tax=Kalanchoe fedtschenkoi TaxID=63787 RepID=A0A7N0TVZ3_KALFE